MMIVQLAPAARLALHVVVRAKLEALVPTTPILLIVSDAVPVFDSVTVCAALVVFSAWLAKVKEVGDIPAIGVADAAPVPFRAAVSVGLTGSELLTVSDAVRAPVAVGLNVMMIVQLAPAARLALHVVVRAKLEALVPTTPILLIVSDAVPVFDSVTVCAALVVFSAWLAKVKEVGDIPAIGEIPVPLRDTVRDGFTRSEVPMVSDAERAAVTVGVNVTLIVQLAPAPRLAPHVFVCAKSPGLVPARPILLIVSADVPVLDTVTIWAALAVFIIWFPNVNAAGDTPAIGAAPARAVLDHAEASVVVNGPPLEYPLKALETIA